MGLMAKVKLATSGEEDWHLGYIRASTVSIQKKKRLKSIRTLSGLSAERAKEEIKKYGLRVQWDKTSVQTLSVR